MVCGRLQQGIALDLTGAPRRTVNSAPTGGIGWEAGGRSQCNRQSARHKGRPRQCANHKTQQTLDPPTMAQGCLRRGKARYGVSVRGRMSDLAHPASLAQRGASPSGSGSRAAPSHSRCSAFSVATVPSDSSSFVPAFSSASRSFRSERPFFSSRSCTRKASTSSSPRIPRSKVSVAA